MGSQKRELQKRRKETAIRKNATKRLLRNVLIGVAVLLLLSVIGYFIYYKAVLVTHANDDYSAGLSDAGSIEGVVATEHVNLADYTKMEVSYDEYMPTEEEIDEQIDDMLDAYKEYTTEPGNFVKLYDRINLDFVGTIDGVAFEGGSTEKGGMEIVVGEAGFVDGFEDQLLGAEVGSNFDIDVLFPEDYEQEDLAGKRAIFNITINGLFVEPKFTDEFVKTNLSDVALTTESYREYLKENGFNIALEEYVNSYIMNNSSIKSYPEDYVQDVMAITKYADKKEYEVAKDFYEMNFQIDLGTLYEYKGAETEMEYEASLRLRAESIVKTNLIYQAIYEDAGLTITSEHIDNVVSYMGSEADEIEKEYGKGYFYQMAMKEAVIEYLIANVKVEK